MYRHPEIPWQTGRALRKSAAVVGWTIAGGGAGLIGGAVFGLIFGIAAGLLGKPIRLAEVLAYCAGCAALAGGLMGGIGRMLDVIGLPEKTVVVGEVPCRKPESGTVSEATANHRRAKESVTWS